MPNFAINGRYLVRKQTGQERFASEIVAELDKIVEKDIFVVVVPEYASEHLPCYQNISIVRYGKVKGSFWEQINFFYYIKKNHLISVNLTTTCPFVSPDVVCIHDAAYYEITKLLTRNIYGKMSTIWHKILAYGAAKWAKKIITVSNYSKMRLSKILNISEDRFVIIRNAWQHYNRIVPDETIFYMLPPKIVRHKFFLALSSLSPQKNFVWVKEVAKRNPDKQFIICGNSKGASNLSEKDFYNNNIFFTGYINDEQVKALMLNCRAFIHPALYEGFGIPPLEALSCGAQLILSTATCLPEIYGAAAHYIDPNNYEYDLDEILKTPVADPSTVLKKFCWEAEAKKLNDSLVGLISLKRI